MHGCSAMIRETSRMTPPPFSPNRQHVTAFLCHDERCNFNPGFGSYRGCDVHPVGAQRAVPLRPTPRHFVPPVSASNGPLIK